MSAQEREALIDALCAGLGWDWPENSAERIPSARECVSDLADFLLAAGWSRPVPAGGEVEAAVRLVVETTALGVEQAREYLTAALELVRAGEVEAATEDVIERIRDEYDLDDDNVVSLREAAVEAIAWQLLDLTCDLSDRQPPEDVVIQAVDDARAVIGRLLAGGVPGREPTLHELVAETYEPEGVGIWWTNWANAEPSKRRSMEASIGYHGGVPGRSEAEIKAEALNEAADELEASQQLAVDFHGNRFAVCGTPWLRARAARVAGTTEAGDDRG